MEKFLKDRWLSAKWKSFPREILNPDLGREGYESMLISMYGDVESADLVYPTYRGMTRFVDFRGVEFSGLRAIDVDLSGLDLTGSCFMDGSFVEGDVISANLSTATFLRFEFKKIIFDESIFKNLTLQECRFEGVRFDRSLFNNVIVKDCVFVDCSFDGVFFDGFSELNSSFDKSKAQHVRCSGSLPDFVKREECWVNLPKILSFKLADGDRGGVIIPVFK